MSVHHPCWAEERCFVCLFWVVVVVMVVVMVMVVVVIMVLFLCVCFTKAE